MYAVDACGMEKKHKTENTKSISEKDIGGKDMLNAGWWFCLLPRTYVYWVEYFLK